MKTLLLSDDVLRDAARVVDDAAQTLLPKPEECTHECSEKLRTFAAELLNRTERRKVVRRGWFRVAAACLAVLLCISTWLAVDAQAREAFFAWVKDSFTDRIVYYFEGEQLSTALPDYRPTWLPNGYKLVYEDKGVSTCSLVYQMRDDVNEGFALTYYIPAENNNLTVYIGEIPHKHYRVEINGDICDVYISLVENEASGIAWMDEKSNMCFYASFTCEEDVALDIVRSIE